VKKLFLTSVAALFLATGTAHAKDDDTCIGPHLTDIPCAELGDVYECGNDLDTLYMRGDHLLSDLSSHTITIYTPLRQDRNGKRYPVIRYDMQTGKLTMNGKQCHLVKTEEEERK
jgi:hypothetical protein